MSENETPAVETQPKKVISEETRQKISAGLKAAKERRDAKLRKKLGFKATPRPLPITPEKIDDAPKGAATASWRPARITDIPTEIKDPRFVYRFIHDNPNSIRKRMMEQWEIDTEIARKMDERFGQRTLHTGLTVDGAYRVNELILARMPAAIAESRRQYFKDKTPVQNPQTLKQRMAVNVGEAGGDARSGVYTQHPSGVIPDMNRAGKWDGIV